jgi:hypothetical protein
VLHGDHVVSDADIPRRQMVFTVNEHHAAEPQLAARK